MYEIAGICINKYVNYADPTICDKFHAYKSRTHLILRPFGHNPVFIMKGWNQGEAKSGPTTIILQ